MLNLLTTIIEKVKCFREHDSVVRIGGGHRRNKKTGAAKKERPLRVEVLSAPNYCTVNVLLA